MSLAVLLVALGVAHVSAITAAGVLPDRSTTVTPMTATDETSYFPAALFASAAYCAPSETATWSCGGQ